MSSCERCWADASSAEDKAERYRELLASRQCTPEQQAGPDAGKCPRCERMTVHQFTGEPMCGCAP